MSSYDFALLMAALQPRIIADSIAPNGRRITTAGVPAWRSLLAEVNTHREQSKSNPSSRAIPAALQRERIVKVPFVPYHWGKNQKGMRAGEPLTREERDAAIEIWLEARDANLKFSERYTEIGVHKSIPNRLTEPFIVNESVITATEWENFFALRLELTSDGAPMAEPHFFDVAERLLLAINASEPRSLNMGEWHLPFLRDEEWFAIDWKDKAAVDASIKKSAARCGRTSYNKQDGIPATEQEDFERHDQFVKDGHMGPVEHQATPHESPDHWSGNFRGFEQYRKLIPGERRRFTGLVQKQWHPR